METKPLGRILVVDDEAPIRTICERVLAREGYQVFTVQNGDEALTWLLHEEVDVVMSDITMPGQTDGPRLLETIKRASPEIDVIMMTGFPSLATAIPTLKEGAYDYLIKPFDNNYLLSVIGRCFDKRRISEELHHERSLRQELAAAYTELQKVEELKEAFLSRLSHELRTPFTALFFAIDQIADEENPKLIAPLIDTLRSRTNALWEIVENLLHFTDLRQQQLPVTRSTIHLPHFVRELIDHYRTEWELRRIAVDVTSIPNDVSIEADPVLLQTAMKHLLLNAIRFNQEAGAVHIRIAQQQEAVQISFIDTGPGIPPEHVARIFENFYQVAEYMTRRVGGLGLGLAIVRQIVEAHGGLVQVTSEFGKGSCFTLALPAHQRSLTHA